jgi:predicted O-linked N-acetylglucosamine transferase (SPINDLY family)
VLWLFRGNPEAEANLRAAAEGHGVDPARLVFADWVPHDQHLARYRHADLALDTRIYNGHTTTSEALWAGVPVVAMTGRHFASRVSSSILAAAGVPELATDSPEAYEALALNLARDADARAALRARISDKNATAPLFDTRQFAGGLEAAYRAMWQRHAAGESPGDIDLSPPPAT